MLLTSTMPVSAQMTTVSQNVAVLDTRAWRTGFRVCAVAATMGALPMPLSLLNRPRAMPYRAAIITLLPTKPPPAAEGLKADFMMRRTAGMTNSLFIHSIMMQPIT